MKVDKFGNIIGGVNPFEGTDVKLEDQPRIDDDEEVRGTPPAYTCERLTVPFNKSHYCFCRLPHWPTSSSTTS